MNIKILSFILIIFLVNCNNNEDYLVTYFERLEVNSSERVIEKFRKTSLQSAVINNAEYDEIFIAASNKILSDTVELVKFKKYFKEHNIDLIGRQDKWLVIAAFHKYLNGEKYQIYDLWNEMSKLSNEEYEKEFPAPKLKY